ncbi:MAG: ABC transporter permease [Dehalococcoidia bacterium]
MNELFGLSMTSIAIGCVIATGLILAFVAWIALRNPVMFKTGLRNIPRRKLQSALIIVGLMLSTLIITAAFGTGDTLTYSVTNETYNVLGPVDELIRWDTAENPALEEDQVVPLEAATAWRETLTADGTVKAVFPMLLEHIPAQNVRTRLNEANPQWAAFRPEDVAPIGGLKDTAGRTVVLGRDEVAVNEKLAKEIDAKVGDTVNLVYLGRALPLKVKAIVPNTVLSGTTDLVSRQGGSINWEVLTELTGRKGADRVAISNTGATRGSLGDADAIEDRLDALVAGTPYEVDSIKRDNLQQAQLVGNIFTSVFVLFGMFSISAGILLIFLIFVMLAAERKPEMGMARAVGAKRRQIVESFLAEGMGYDLGSAVIGMFAGIGVAAVMTTLIGRGLGDEAGLDLAFNVTARSLIVALCIGIIVTFIVVFFASWRASRLNIVSAIRDLPESKPYNPEAATVMGYLRGTLNAFAAFGILVISLIGMLHYSQLLPLFALAALTGFAGPWIPMLRNHNFGAPRSRRKSGERLPWWPLLLLPFVLPVIGYGLAILITRIVRDRKPSSVPRWLLLAAILVAPLGVLLSALQDKGRAISWSAGFGVVGLVAGAILVEWGISADRMAPFALGASFIVLWAALTLRYFHFNERAVFTTGSIVLLALWYLLPGGRLEALFGTLNADFEMFFISGAVLVTCGTFIVVYNADIILPAVARLGSRFGRLAPAVKTAVAYPLTSKFRTGLTMAMIGLIIFVLSLQSSLNSNFEKAFVNDDAKGGFDTRVSINGNNATPDFLGTLVAGNAAPDAPQKADPAAIEAVGGALLALPWQVDIEDPKWASLSPELRKEEDRYKHTLVMGVDAGFIDAQAIPLQFRAAGYADDRAVWQALKSGSFAILPALLTQNDGGFGPPSEFDDPLTLDSDATSEGFQPFILSLRNRSTGEQVELTVIGQAKDSAGTFWPGIVTSLGFVEANVADATDQQFFLRTKPGVDSRTYAKQVESVLVQAQADSLDQEISDLTAQNRTFLQVFQGFLALGLLVGIAALGVISLRSVVERRQQIGMLRAIGYKRSMVQASFLMESGFIALSGIVIGLVLGLSFAANLFTSGEFGETTKGLGFTIPWTGILLTTGFAFVASMVTTYLPARSASRVAVAEALRYE